MDRVRRTGAVARGIPPAAPPLVALGAGLAGAVYLWHTDPYQGGQPLPRCPVHWATGLLCPACGGTRMSYDLLHLDLPGAFVANPVLLTLGVPLGLYLSGRWLAAGLRGERYRPRFSTAGSAAVLAVAGLWMVARNLLG
ncbi:DUF2752 domain-containing protein [Streptomyces sp. DSM 44915]|uniref:DUF2752 domain-containing protein n=1 Tax=Streptomyces chisholmiae TaxID=3075540 RepID=A0ABU2JLT7_9ACTN|nr:DUF2752 domain-containing protein [Streptomyces sp. DSM 44915]MDT0265925.1 DUF2752 domain-containing protein [Streptomyces sp. DSM 44915]